MKISHPETSAQCTISPHMYCFWSCVTQAAYLVRYTMKYFDPDKYFFSGSYGFVESSVFRSLKSSVLENKTEKLLRSTTADEYDGRIFQYNDDYVLCPEQFYCKIAGETSRQDVDYTNPHNFVACAKKSIKFRFYLRDCTTARLN